MARGSILTVEVKDIFLNQDDEKDITVLLPVRLHCVTRRITPMSAYLGPFDKQHDRGDGAVKCHGNEP